MNAMIGTQEDRLDEEWLALILKAKQLGLTLEEIRAFFGEQQHKDMGIEVKFK